MSEALSPSIENSERNVSTDSQWEQWGHQDPYYGVLTHPKFRSAALTPEALEEFFALGRMHVDHVLGVCRRHIDEGFEPKRILDFGCGVGRLVIPFAKVASEVVGVDISPSMLSEARKNCDNAGVSNVSLVGSDDQLSLVDGQFDLVHTCIVIQHIEIPRGLQIFSQLIQRIKPGGMGALHVTFAWDHHANNFGFPLPPTPPEELPWWRQARRAVGEWIRGHEHSVQQSQSSRSADPEMQMNFYNLSQLMFIIQQAGVEMVHNQLTDHGGAIGTFMFFRKTA